MMRSFMAALGVGAMPFAVTAMLAEAGIGLQSWSAGDLTNAGATASTLVLLGWYLRHTTTKTLPAKEKAAAEAMEKMAQRFDENMHRRDLTSRKEVVKIISLHRQAMADKDKIFREQLSHVTEKHDAAVKILSQTMETMVGRLTQSIEAMMHASEERGKRHDEADKRHQKQLQELHDAMLSRASQNKPNTY